MTKNDLKLISSFIDTKNQRIDLNYAHLLDDGIYAFDTRKAIHFNIPMLDLDILLHKKILAGFTSIMATDDNVTIDSNGYIRIHKKLKMDCNTPIDMPYERTQIKNIFNQAFDYKITLEEIDDIHFELTQKNCFIDDIHLNAIIEYSNCNNYEIFYNKQKIEDGKTNTGMVKIIGLYNTEDEYNLVKFTAIIMGREFKTQAQEQLLFDLK
jgi:hypothetical protein